MAKPPAYAETDRLCRSLVADAAKGVFRQVYLLMGEEPYYVDMVCNAVLANCIDESEKDFNEIVCYGSDVNADAVITAARRYPMFAERQLVVVREAQAMRDVEELAAYCQEPLESTVLVICMMGEKADKRRALYKSVQKCGVVVDSPALRDYEVPGWVDAYYSSIGLSIDPDAANLLAESAGTDLGKIVVETDKMMKNLPEGVSRVSVEDVEKNVGVSRSFSVFELTKALSYRDSRTAMRVSTFMGAAAKFALPMVTGALFTHFNRILRLHALLMKDPRADNASKAAVLGVSPFFVREYDAAVRNYPLKKCMAVIGLLKEYDYKGKGGDAGAATPAELLVELTARILS